MWVTDDTVRLLANMALGISLWELGRRWVWPAARPWLRWKRHRTEPGTIRYTRKEIDAALRDGPHLRDWLTEGTVTVERTDGNENEKEEG